MTVPVFIGRHVMGLWMGQGAVVHELYTGACGLYICWLVLRLGSVMMTWVPHGLELLMVKVREYALLVSYSDAIKSEVKCNEVCGTNVLWQDINLHLPHSTQVR